MIHRISDGLAFAALRDEWALLHTRAGAHAFLRWEWLYPAWRRLAPRRELRLYVARDAAGALAGVLPLSREGRVLRFLGDETIGSDGLDVLAADAGTARELWRHALDDGGWDVAELLDIDSESTSLPALRLLGAERELLAGERRRYDCPKMLLAGRPESFLRQVPRGETLQRRRRWFARQPDCSIDVAHTPLEVSRALEGFFHLHRLRWAPMGGSDAITGPEIAAFHRDATWFLAERDAVRLYTLRMNKRAIASLYVLRQGRSHAMYQSGYDPAFSDRSPGLCLLAQSIEDARAEGAEEYDFLRGEEPYKLEWSTSARKTVSIRLVRRSAAGLALAGASGASRGAREMAKKLLPERYVEAIRQARRRLNG